MVNNLQRFPVATVGALIENGGEILLVRTHKWSGTWGIPGGKVEYGETLIAALKREILEETGLALTDIRWCCVQDCIRPKEFIDSRAHFLLFNYIAGSPARDFKLNEEATEGKWVKAKEALKLNLNEPTRILVKKYLK